jgi:FemAB-related protein (PEP-CTERM system-associated)
VTQVTPTTTHAGARATQIHTLDAATAPRWNEFVRNHAEATFFHLAEWCTVLERAFGHPTYFLYAEERGVIQGVLPLGQIRSRLFGNALISTPFCVYGGILAANERAHHELTRSASDLAARLRVDYLELRNRRRQHPSWPCKDLYVTFRKALEPEPEKNLLAIPRKQRAMVRKGIKAGLTSAEDDRVERLFSIYSESVHNLGTPVFPRRYFRTLKEVFGDQCEILTILRDDRPVSSVLSFYFRDEVLPYYGGGTAEARDVAANDFMYWEVMRRACERGLRVFDYGRSKREVGSYRFKKHWGFEPEPLCYEYQLVRANAIPDVNPLNPRYRFFIKVWKSLPLGVTRVIGPLLARNLG